MRMRKDTERGEGRIGFLIGIIVVAIVVFLAVKLIPVRVRAYQFADYMQEEAQRAAWNKDENTLKKHVLQRAQELGLPVNEKNIDIGQKAGQMVVNARYDVPIDLKVTTYVMQFDQTESAPLF